jgi:site-specific recombinase XerD
MIRKITDSNIKAIVSSLDSPLDKRFDLRDTAIKGFVANFTTKGSIKFYLRYRNSQGRQKTYVIGSYGPVTTAMARDIAKEKMGEVAKGIDIQGEKLNARLGMASQFDSTLRAFINSKYADWIRTERKTGEEALARILRNFEELLDTPMNQITSWQLTSWRKTRLQNNVSPSTLNRDISTLKALLAKAVEWGDLQTHPLNTLKPLKTDKTGVIRFLSEEEAKRLRLALDERQVRQRQQRSNHINWLEARKRRKVHPFPESYTDYLKPLTILALNTGMRRGELFDLRVHDLNFEQRILTVKGETAKSGTSRYINLNREAVRTLETWLKEQKLNADDLVFANPKTGERLTNIRKSWGNLMEAARISKFRFHDLRHTFASNLVMKGADLYTVKELLGHSSIETTQRYAHLAPEHKARAVELLNG